MLHQNEVQYHGTKPLGLILNLYVCLKNRSISGSNLGGHFVPNFRKLTQKSAPEVKYYNIGLHFGATLFSSTPSL